MDNKKLTILRLAIFYILSIIPLIAVSTGLFAVFGEPVFVSDKPEVLKWAFFLSAWIMFAPSIAHLLTRLITKEGWKNTYLSFTEKKGSLKYFAFATIYKPVEALVVIFILWKAFLGDMSFSEVFNLEKPFITISLILLQLAGSFIFFFPAFGEEWGWRGYMMPKLFELMPKPAAIVVGGVLWGLWHAPLTVIGHDFGVDYPGFPFVGIALMCVFCIGTNAVFTFLTERTKSIFPASFCHMINNNLSPFVIMPLLLNESAAAAANEKITTISAALIFISVSLITAAICFVLFIKKEKE